MRIQGRTAAEIASSIRTLVDTRVLGAGDGLPTSRELASRLGVNRNTVISAYRQLARAGVAVSNRGGGTSITQPMRLAEEGFTPDTVLRDVSSGNPDRALLPDPASVRMGTQAPVLYGESTLDPGLAAWARPLFEADQPRDFRLTVTSGAVDATGKLLAQTLSHGDCVALEDPCYLTSINAVRHAGYRPVPVPVDRHGMTAAGLGDALESGARAVVCTPRAHNPTGVSVSAERAAELRGVLADYPQVLVVEDDHFSLLSASPYHTLIPAGHERWALVRSVSKFLGPDLRLALVASDPVTAQRFATQISAGTTWVSHLLQRTVHAMLLDDAVRTGIERAGAHYRNRNTAFIGMLDERRITGIGDDGLNVWVDAGPGSDADAVVAQLMRRGWAARPGGNFALGAFSGAGHIRLTVHELDEDSAIVLANDVAASIEASGPAGALP